MSNVVITASNVSAVSFPLPIYEARMLGELESNGETFSICVGLGKPLVEQLREKSLDTSDTDLQENTSDHQRFGEGSYEEWYAKDRTPFALVHKKTGALAALVWFGPKPLGRKSLKYLSEEELQKESQQKEEEWHTLVYRSYLPFRGKGLMKEFVQFTINAYKTRYPEAKLWVGGRAAKMARGKIAEKLGFKRRDDLFDAEKNWAAMTLE